MNHCAVHLNRSCNMLLGLSIILGGLMTVQPMSGQAVHPQNLFDTGLNMGYLGAHSEKGYDGEGPTIWAGNAAAEWLDSWMPGMARPITPSLDNPEIAHQAMLSDMRQMTGCGEPYFTLRISLYRTGYHLGRAIAETNYDCSRCLRSEMQKTEIELRTIGQFLNGQSWRDLADELKLESEALNLQLSGTSAREQNHNRLEPLQGILDRLNILLIDELIPCEEKPEKDQTPEPEDEPSPSKEEDQKERKRQILITVGYTGATLHGENGTESQSGDGWYVGFDMLRGDPVFLLLGLDFFRNSAGEEFFIPIMGQLGGPGEFIQGFRAHGGLGGHVIKRDEFRLSVFGDLRLIIGSSIDGDLSSIGNVVLEDTPLHLNLGTYISYNRFSLHTSYDLGLTPVLTRNDEEMKYRMWNLGLGVNF